MKATPRKGFTVVISGFTAASALIAGALAASPAQEKPPEKATVRAKADTVPAAGTSSTSTPTTVKVEKGTFKVQVEMPGVFEPTKMIEIAIKPRGWSMPMVVDKAVDLGTAVKQGDILVEIEHDKIDKAIQDAEVDLAVGELALKHAAEELPILEKLLPLDLAAAERARSQADEDLARFIEIDRPNSEKMAAFAVKSGTEYLEYAKEELRQLEKMYRSKDLTEETEEIILRRTRFQVESSEQQLKQSEHRRDATLKVELPRQEIRVREGAARQALELQKARASLPLTLSQKQTALAKLRHDHARAAEKLADLRHDRDAMTVHAPADGLVYYGRNDRGSWPGAAMIAAKLRKGGVLMADEVVITLVTPRPLVIRSSVEEKDLHHLAGRADLKGRAIPVVDPALSLPVHLTSLTPVPREAGKYDVVSEVELGLAAALIKPGMACTLKFTPYHAADALTVPASAVSDEDADDGAVAHVVYRPVKEGKPVRQVVKAGKTSGGKTEILDGLREGDEILSSKP